MKPTKLQYFFAQAWPFRILFTLVPLLFIVEAIRICEPSLVLLTDWRYLLRIVGIVFLALVLGILSSLLIGCFVIRPMNYYCAVKNGAPFREGDLVRILARPHRDRIVRVCQVCESSQWVRVELGKGETKGEEDVFPFSTICIEQEAGGTRGEGTSC
jgi:hypothetical protein